MTGPVSEVMAALAVALSGDRRWRFSADLAGTVQPPTVVLGPPELSEWGYDGQPHVASFSVAVVVAESARAVGELLALLPAVVAAVDSVPDVAVSRAAPGTWPAGNLPCYLIEIEASL
jgi:hypothetical protein